MVNAVNRMEYCYAFHATRNVVYSSFRGIYIKYIRVHTETKFIVKRFRVLRVPNKMYWLINFFSICFPHFFLFCSNVALDACLEKNRWTLFLHALQRCIIYLNPPLWWRSIFDTFYRKLCAFVCNVIWMFTSM